MSVIAVRGHAGRSAVAIQQRQRGAVAVRQASRPVVLAAGLRGKPGRDGVDGAEVSAEAGNQLKIRDDGLYVGPLTWDTNGW